MCATCVLLVCYVAKLRASADNPRQRKPLYLRYFLELPFLRRFFDQHGHCHGCADHGVVALYIWMPYNVLIHHNISLGFPIKSSIYPLKHLNLYLYVYRFIQLLFPIP